MKKLFTFALFGFVAVALTLVPEMAHAAGGDGTAFLKDITDALAGTYGTIFGLLLALMGLYMWLVQQASWGIVLIIGGVVFTVFPSIFTNIKSGITTTFDKSIKP